MSLNTIGRRVITSLKYFEVIKAPPSVVPLVEYINDNTFPINNLHKKFFQFKYRYVYDDNEKSVWSAISKMPIIDKSTNNGGDTQGGFQNAITININTGDFNVLKIEIAGRINIENEWSEFFLIDTIDKKIFNLTSNSQYIYTFRNDSIYNQIDLQESNLLFDYVPDEANALELANGNTLVVGGLKDGYNRDTKLDVTITTLSMKSPATISTLDTLVYMPNFNNGPIVWNGGYDFNRYNYVLGSVVFTGTPSPGDEITISLYGRSVRQFGTFNDRYDSEGFEPITLTVTVDENDTLQDIVFKFQTHPNRFSNGFAKNVGNAGPRSPFVPIPSDLCYPLDFTVFPNTLYIGAFEALYNGTCSSDSRKWEFWGFNISIKKAYSFNDSDVFPSLKWNGVYKYGLVYYDRNGKTNGVFTNSSMSLRTETYKTSNEWTPPGSPIIIPENETVQMYIGHEPPSWAEYYHIVRTKELSCDFSLMVSSPNVVFNSGYWFIDIHNIPATYALNSEVSNVLNYSASTFVQGDRVRILQKIDGNGDVSFSNDKHLDLPIISVETPTSSGRQNIKVKAITIPPGYINVQNGNRLVIEIYRPAKVLSDKDLVYYETGNCFTISTDANGKKFHNGQSIVTNITLANLTANGNITFNSSSKEISFIPNTQNFLLLNNIFNGDKINISGSLLNDGVYTVIATSTYTFLTAEPLVNETISASSITLTKISQTNKNYAYVNLSDDGDYYYRARVMVNNTDNTTFGTLYIVDNNFSENYKSAVWSQGRPLIVDEDIKEEYYPSMLRFSQSYIYGTNINNLSRFYPNNFEEADASFGDILRLKTRENFIRMFQRYKVGMIPVYRQIIIDNAQSSQVALSERLLNKPNYYSGEYGIDKYGSSLVSTDYGDYFIDTNNKAIVRVSLDGITNVSDTNNLSAWANENIKEDSFGYGCFNYENRNIIMLIGHKQSIPQFPSIFLLVKNIVAYSESDKNFESFYGFTDAENIQFANGLILTGYQGEWYIHDNNVRNNFFGQQQSSAITTIFNGGLQMKKTYTAIEELANGLWTGSVATGPLTNQLTSLTAADFQKTIGAYVINSKENKFNATIKRDQNSAGGKFQGDTMKGLYAQVALTNSLTTQQRLISVSLKYITSPLTNS